MVDINQQLHVRNTKLYKSGNMARMQWELSLATVNKSIAKAEQSRNLWMEYTQEALIGKKRLAVLTGTKIALVEMAQDLARLWEIRRDKFKASEDQAKADYDYFIVAHDIVKKQVTTHHSAEYDRIGAERDMKQAGIVWKLAKELTDQNEANYQRAKETVKKVEQQEGPKEEQSEFNDI